MNHFIESNLFNPFTKCTCKTLGKGCKELNLKKKMKTKRWDISNV